MRLDEAVYTRLVCLRLPMTCVKHAIVNMHLRSEGTVCAEVC